MHFTKGETMARMTVEQRRAALIDAAYEVIAESGVEGATTRRVCAHAEMPLASFHYAFESRMALLGAVIEQAVPRDLVVMIGEIQNEVPPGGMAGMRREMTDTLRNLGDLMLQDAGRLQATASLAIFAHNHPELRSAGRKMYSTATETVAQALEVAAAKHGTAWSIEPGELGTLLISATDAIKMAYLTTSDEKVARTVVDGVVTWMMTYAVDERADG
ncbi:MAG: TetR family transcriptional regulator [Gordonia sp. (in: high G+C Gram-positive bacteria)]|uniref:TetR/AcrR family transcriptional regulator n=1 Tax=Gordonia sp. (in: high G+C Gram-positive bacteria) TaxID=84139 RepID=UPI0039E5ED49